MKKLRDRLPKGRTADLLFSYGLVAEVSFSVGHSQALYAMMGDPLMWGATDDFAGRLLFLARGPVTVAMVWWLSRSVLRGDDRPS